MNHDLAIFLNNKKPLAEAWPAWFNGRMPLRQHTYLSQETSPDEYVSSARAILFRENEVMVIRDHKNEPYIVPGGRREPGETVLETLHREVLKETGFHPLPDVLNLEIRPGQTVLLNTAVKQYEGIR